jgi:hypothetical protein
LGADGKYEAEHDRQFKTATPQLIGTHIWHDSQLKILLPVPSQLEDAKGTGNHR